MWRWYNPILITFTPDGQAVYNPDYLTDVKPETVDGNTRITYTINPKATYNDGSPIDWRCVRGDLEDQQRHGPGLPRHPPPTATTGSPRSSGASTTGRPW